MRSKPASVIAMPKRQRCAVYTRKSSEEGLDMAFMDLIKNRATSAPTGPQRLAAGMVEGAVVTEMRRMLRTPDVAARAIEALREAGVEPDERAVVAALAGFDDLWASLFPAEQGRIVQLVVQRVTVSGEGIAVDLRNHGLGSVVREMLTPPRGQ